MAPVPQQYARFVERLAPLEMAREQVSILQELGEGQFGKVGRISWRGVD
jgi:hypothetical protein